MGMLTPIKVTFGLNLNNEATFYEDFFESIEQAKEFVEICRFISENKLTNYKGRYEICGETKNEQQKSIMKLDSEKIKCITFFIIDRLNRSLTHLSTNQIANLNAEEFSEQFAINFGFLWQNSYEMDGNVNYAEMIEPMSQIKIQSTNYKKITHYFICDKHGEILKEEKFD